MTLSGGVPVWSESDMGCCPSVVRADAQNCKLLPAGGLIAAADVRPQIGIETP
jgi:hypothetical protein